MKMREKINIKKDNIFVEGREEIYIVKKVYKIGIIQKKLE